MSTTTSAQPDVFVTQRPEGLSDTAWNARIATAHRVITGHAPWCTDHYRSPEDPASESWCRHVMTWWCGETVIHNGTLDGRTVIAFTLADRIDVESLSIAEAGAIGSMLDMAQGAAKVGNLASEIEDPH